MIPQIGHIRPIIQDQSKEIARQELRTGLYFLSGVSSSGERASCKFLIQK
jgi:hypothetical protein